MILLKLNFPLNACFLFCPRIKDEKRELRVVEKQGGNNSVTSTQTFLIPSVCRKLDIYVIRPALYSAGKLGESSHRYPAKAG